MNIILSLLLGISAAMTIYFLLTNRKNLLELRIKKITKKQRKYVRNISKNIAEIIGGYNKETKQNRENIAKNKLLLMQAGEDSNEDNVLMLLKNTTAEEALAMGVRDAVSWGPFLIVNGESSTVSGNGGWGGGARSAIGQRKDGTVLFLVVDSNASRTTGAGMEDLVRIMENYGAYNAANLDGGTSSVMVLPREIAQSQFGAPCTDYFTGYACAINDPIDAAMIHRTRYVATAFVVTNNQ